ncbi:MULTISPECIES: DNA-3-methyladenine glycosylase 2 [Planococcus]|uniref:DNA-3-methyladenine glycosylase II n=1 Tax=Planococcus faecalis TaxID=1598147 RepID=A0ABN4XM65_9BACL|nr:MULTISPECIES: DNA-3-methyladenine glycosylase 2 [Planococcus]AQU80771.1 DNA-3-methyladenine glycosylase [Planococcus faecalis]MDJ0331988.1 DNA-3-methyladenine glycosylase 2 [Planococcus sp. S3-L1]OHX55757.1 DNA-3-methyladenine glycosylase [Planococcus faecalis]
MMKKQSELYMEISTPVDFNFMECLVHLGRSSQENLYRVQNARVTKVLKLNNELVLFHMTPVKGALRLAFPLGAPTASNSELVRAYVEDWFDLQTDLQDFYAMAQTDSLLSALVQQYRGLRVIGVPDLFEALVWAVMGQQINLTFAYTLKKRFVESYGESLIYEEERYWTFPSPEKIALLSVTDLRALQLTGRKAEYILGIALAMTNGTLSKEQLLQEQDMERSLLEIRGIGAWSANYVMMKCLHSQTAFPLADVGLHNALKVQLNMERKPTQVEITKFAEKWRGWEAYATFYLWRSLL